MVIPTLYSAKRIEQQFHTGEEPVMVMCSDVNIYVCKYMRSSATAYKLACEFIRANLAKALTTHVNRYYPVVGSVPASPSVYRATGRYLYRQPPED